MNYRRKNFEERMEKANLSEEQKERYRQLSVMILRRQVMNGYTKVSAWAEKIRPLVTIDGERIVFNSMSADVRKSVVVDVPNDENIFVSLQSETVQLCPLKCNLTRICIIPAYLPNRDNNPQLPELSALRVLGQLPENVPVGQAKYYEVCFNSDNPEDDYDEILQAHKVKIILYAPAYDLLKRARDRVREFLSESKDQKANEQSPAVEPKKVGIKPERKKNPCQDVPQRQG